jgi:hypothetical protein
MEEVESQKFFDDFKGFIKSHLRVVERMPDKHLL